MKKRRNRSDSSAWMALPLYIFTIVFVVCPLIYMVALSFATPSRGFGVTWKFTLDNYRNILEPVYLNTFVESLKLAFTSTIVIALIGYPFGYFPIGGRNSPAGYDRFDRRRCVSIDRATRSDRRFTRVIGNE